VYTSVSYAIYKSPSTIIWSIWFGWRIYPESPKQTEEISHTIDQGVEEDKDMAIKINVLSVTRPHNVFDDVEYCKRDEEE